MTARDRARSRVANRRPCAGCPWSPTTPGFLRGARAEEIADVARYGATDFYCHKTTEERPVVDGGVETDETEMVPTGSSALCAGYLIAAARDGVPGPMARIEARLGMLDAEWYEECDPEHDLALDPDEFEDHHGRAEKLS